MRFEARYCHSHESENPFLTDFRIVDTRFRGYDTRILSSCLTSVAKFFDNKALFFMTELY